MPFMDFFGEVESLENHGSTFYDVSRIVFSITQDFYNEAAKIAVRKVLVISYQTYGEIDDTDPTRSLGPISQEELNSGLSMSLISCFERFF